MAADIAPLAPVNPSPLVREKRHFHGEQHQQGSKQNRQPESQDKTELQDSGLEQQEKEKQISARPDGQNNTVDQDEEHATVQHLDEYV